MSLPLTCGGGDMDPDSVTRLKQKHVTESVQSGEALESGAGYLWKPDVLTKEETQSPTAVHDFQEPSSTNAETVNCRSEYFTADVTLQSQGARSPVASVMSMATDSQYRDINFGLPPSFLVSLDPQDRPWSSVSPTGSDDSKHQDIDFRGEAAPDMSGDHGPALSQDTLCCVCSKTAVKSCLTCSAYYCGVHVRHHYTSPALQKHTLVEAEDLRERLCERHGRVLEIFCSTDQTSICTLCMLDHIGHNFSLFATIESHRPADLKGHVNKALLAPGQIQFSSVTSDSVSLSWGSPVGLAGSQRFRVVWGCAADQRSLEVEGLTVDVEGLQPGKDYNFSVATISNDGSQSAWVSASVQTEVPQPENLTVITQSSFATLRWNKPKGMDEVSFSISLYDAEDICVKTIIKHSPECSFFLEPDAVYNFAISTVLKNGKKSSSITRSICTNILVPDNLKSPSVTSTSVALAWSLPPRKVREPHTFLISYQSEGSEPHTVSSDSCSTVITGLKPHTLYSITVCTKIQSGGESKPATLTITTEISPPCDLQVILVSPVSAYITWRKSPEMKGIPHKFKIVCQSKGGRVQSTSTDLCTKLLKDLKPLTEYTVRVYTKVHGGMESKECSTTFTTGKNQESFLQDVGLHHHKKLSLNSVLEISHDSIFEQSCESMKHLSLYFIRKLMWCNASISCASVDKKTGVTENVNPLDLITAIFHCSDPFLQQTLCSKMSQCQLAVPLLLPNCDTQQSTLMLWALRDIVKIFKPYDLEDPKGSMQCRVATTPMPLVSFVRLGNSSMSKSKCLNDILSPSQQYKNMFVHRGMECGDVPRKISDGLVEISWFLPSGKSSIDVFRQPIAFANLRGDIRMFEAQFSFLCQTSCAVFVFIDESETDFSILTNSRTSKLYLVIPEAKSRSSDISGEMHMMDASVIRKGSKNDAAFISALRIHILADIIQEQENLTSVEAMVGIAHKTGLLVDEKCLECCDAQMLSRDILNGIMDITKFKADVLPRQGDMWKDISCLEREKCQLKKSGQGDIEQYKSRLNKNVNNLRTKQRDTEVSKFMTYFINSISKSGTKRSYFLKSLRMSLHSLAGSTMSDLKNKYKDTLKQHPEQEEDVQKLAELISQCSLGLEHFFREVGQLYESVALDGETSRAKDLQHLPGACAQLLLEGFPLELLDGDASNIPLKWIEDIFRELHKLVKPKCVLSVVTVLGVQNTGKSTLLNTMFGIQFAVSSGKCTRGAFMQLIKVSEISRRELKCDYIMVIDTEGLKSPELAEQVDSYVHDNELATLVIGLSDVAIINMSMGNVTEMMDIMQISVHAFLRMKEVKKKPRCLFVHQNMADVAAHDSNLWDRQKMIKLLNTMTEAAARMEKINAKTCFTDVMDYDPEKDSYYIPGLWQGTPPMATVNAGYSAAVYELKKGLISALKGAQHGKHDLCQFYRLTKELWQTVRFENFIFNFRNSLVAEAYSKLCQEWNRWEWEFQKEIYKWSVAAEAKITNFGMSGPDSETDKLMLQLVEKVYEEKIKVQTSLQQYFDSQGNSLYLIEKYRAEFEISVESLRRTTQASLESSLQTAIEVQNGKKQLRQINNTQSQTIETKVLELLKSFKGKESNISDEILTNEFDKMWTKTRSEFPYSTLPKKTVGTDALHILKINFQTFPGHIQKLLIEENLPECGRTPFDVEEKSSVKHWEKSWKVQINPMDWSKFSNKHLEDKVASYLTNVIKAGENIILKKRTQKQDYKREHLHELLHTIDEELQSCDIKFDEEVEASLKMHIFGIAIRKFQKMHDEFIDQNDPQKCLERAKEKFLSQFMNLYHEQDLCQRKATEFADSCLKPAIFEYVTKTIGPEIVDEMKTGHDAASLSVRSSFQYTLLFELLEKHNYDDYKKFIDCYETYVKDWIFEKIVQKMSKDNRLEQMEKSFINVILKKLTDDVAYLKTNQNTLGNVSEFIKFICGRQNLILPDDAMQGFMTMRSQFHNRTKEFAGHIEEHIEDMLLKLNVQYEGKDDITKRLHSLAFKPQDVLFKSLFGCGEQCPFCYAPCEAGAGGVEHKYHTTSIHRPQGTSVTHEAHSNVIAIDICSSSVISNNAFRSKETEYKVHPYKHYRKVYPDWEIQGDATIEAAAYWKFFMVNFNEQIASDNRLKPAIIPDDWKSLTKADALKCLKEAFHKTETPFCLP